MNTNDTKQIKQRIKEEYDDNCIKIDELETKMYLLKRSGFEMKFANASVLSTILWIATISFWPSILKSGLVPLELTRPLFTLVPILLGTTISTIIDKKQKINKRLKEFSSARTKKEKIEEEARYKIEQEKLRSYNEVLKNNYDYLETNEKLISSLSDKYNITSKENDDRDKKEVEENVEKYKKLLKERTNDMDIATTRHSLYKLFWNVISKLDRFFDATTYGGLGILFCMLIYNAPMYCANSMENIQFQTSLFGILAPAIVVGFACTYYGFKRNYDRLSVFRNINDELKENAISESKDFDDKDLEQEKNKIINDTCVIRRKLENDIQKLASLNNDEQILEEVYQNPKPIKQLVEKEKFPSEEKAVVLKKKLFFKNKNQ